MNDTPRVSILIPCFNEEKGLELVLSKIKAIDLRENYEVIVIDDGSTDKTFDVAKKYGVIVIRHPYNKGYGASLKAGTRRASSNIIVIMDGDGQHNPEDIKRLISDIGTYDMVVGVRSAKSPSSLYKRLGKALLNLVANYLSGQKILDLNSGFRAINKERLKEFIHILPNGFSFSTTITLAFFKEAYNVKFVPITTMARYGGRSRVNHLKDGLQTMLLIIRVIMLFNPLKVFIPMSLILGCFGVMFSFYGIIKYHSFPRTGVTAILASIMIFVLGVLADQIAMIRRHDK